MFTHLLQIASFKSQPQNFSTPAWVLIVVVLCLAGVQGYSLSLSPGNELVRMFVASGIQLLVLGAMVTSWLRSVKANEYFLSTMLVIVFVSLLAEVFKLPLTMMIRNAEDTSDAVYAILLSIPLLAIVAWQYVVWFYVLTKASGRSKVEVITVIITFILISLVVGTVLSKIGSPVVGMEG